MTGNQIFEIAASYFTQTRLESEDLQPFVPMWLNVLLEESLPYENALRLYEGKEVLKQAPFLTQEKMNEEIPYASCILRTALPYGLASDFWRDDDNDYRTNEFRARYISALQDTLKTQAQPIQNIY